MEIKFTVSGTPKGKQRPRVCRIKGRSITYTPKQTVDYENQIRSIYSKVANFKFERHVPLEVAILALFEPPKSISRKVRALMLGGEILPTKRPDGDNVIKVILDALNGVAFHDNGQVCKIYFDLQCAAPVGEAGVLTNRKKHRALRSVPSEQIYNVFDRKGKKLLEDKIMGKTLKIFDNDKEIYNGNCSVNTVIFRGRIYSDLRKVSKGTAKRVAARDKSH